MLVEYLRRALAGTSSKESADFRQLRGGGRQGQRLQRRVQPAVGLGELTFDEAPVVQLGIRGSAVWAPHPAG